MLRDCPFRGDTPGRNAPASATVVGKREAPGRNTLANANAIEATLLPGRPEDLTEIQLEQLLAEKWLRKENAELPTGSQANVVRASKEKDGGIGTLLHVEVLIEGLPVKAMIDTGAQSTIISRATLHDVCRHLKQQQLPPLEKLTVRLYGKDGPKKGRELVVTAQVSLLFSLGSKSVSIPVFAQQDSEQPCLLGINAIPALGIDVSWSNGNSCEPTSTIELSVATVCLVESVMVPCNKGLMVQVKLSGMDLGCDLLFEPDFKSLEPYGVTAQESVLSATEQGEMVLAIENYQGITAHLEVGMHLGMAKPTEVIAVDSESSLQEVDPSVSASVNAVENSSTRMEQLFCSLTPEVERLKTLIANFSDVFALSDGELGCTDVLQHPIDTGDHPPIKQQPSCEA